MTLRRLASSLLLYLAGACQQSAPSVPDVQLTLRADPQHARSFSLSELAKHGPARVVETDDPYYRAHKRFRAIPLNEAIVYGFGKDLSALRKESFVLRARDGYAVPIEGSRLLEGGAYLAFDDVDVPGFAPIGPQQVSPAPTYLVWSGATQTDLDAYPRPWQLVAIEIAPFASLYPHTVPSGEAAQSDAMQGFEVFRGHCLKCHAINREGGRVGPDLNVPQSIVEYRPVEQIRAYIKNPALFRYGAMPAHPQLTEGDLDHLIAYFGAMSRRKHDTDAEPKP